MSNNTCNTQTNTNFLNDNSFKFKILNSPNVTFFCTKVGIPELSIETTKQATLYNAVPYPGDELNYGDLIVTFKIQENFKDYLEVYNWLTTSAHPINLSDLYQQQIDIKNYKSDIYAGEANNGGIFSDSILTILDNSLNPQFEIKFFDCFPVRLSGVEFSTQVPESSSLQATVSLKYTYFKISEYVI